MDDEVYVLRNGALTHDRRLDRIPFFDPRSKEWPIRTLLPEQRPLRSYTWSIPVQLDQGREGACTGFAVAMEAAARPVLVPGITNEVAREVYVRAKQIDQWPGEDYEGSSTIAAVKAGVERGWYDEYRWGLGPGAANAARDAACAVGYRGPVIFGTNWYEGMFSHDADGFLNVTGRAVGGHCYMSNAFSVKRMAFWVPNSWAGEGAGWLRLEDVVRLLEEDGEVAIPVKRSKGAA